MKHAYMRHKHALPMARALQTKQLNVPSIVNSSLLEANEKVSIDEAKTKIDSIPLNILLANERIWR